MVVTRKEAAIINHERLQIKGTQELSKTGVLVAKLKLKIKEKSNEGAENPFPRKLPGEGRLFLGQ